MSPRIERVRTRVFDVPTIVQPETDGTAAWSSTTMVLVELRAGGLTGIGYTYVHAAAARLAEDVLAACARGASAFDIGALHGTMIRAVRNHGRAGIAACAISAFDVAMWDLKARLLGVSLCELVGAARADVPVYASGGFTSTPLDALEREVAGYVSSGHRRIKIKIGRPGNVAIERARVAKAAAGDAEIMVDANGAFTRKEAIAVAAAMEELGVVYFEEPVSSDDLDGLRAVRDASRLDVAAGEYGYDAQYFHHMLDAQAVDILQADATRCLGFTGFLQADALCDATGTPLSAHCAPALHVHVGRASRRLVHVEHFFDHARLEAMLFDGSPTIVDGTLVAAPARQGLGLVLRDADAARFAA